MNKRLRRMLRAQARDALVLFQESRIALLVFGALIVGGGLVFHFLYTFPGTDQHPGFAESFHATFALIFFETLLPFPAQWYLQILFFIIPIVGLAAVADGVLRLGAALVNKQARGQQWQVAMASTYSEHVIVCGTGKVGYRVIQELLKFGREIVALETDPEGRFVEKVKALNIPLLICDARRSENLIKAGVARADAIVPCTDNELANLDIALDARELNPKIKVVMRMYDADLARRVEKGFDIHTAFSTSSLAAPIFAAAAMRVDVKYSFYAGDELLIISELVLAKGSPLVGWSVEKIEATYNLSIVRYQHHGRVTLHPRPEVLLESGDSIMVLAELETVRKLSAYAEGA